MVCTIRRGGRYLAQTCTDCKMQTRIISPAEHAGRLIPARLGSACGVGGWKCVAVPGAGAPPSLRRPLSHLVIVSAVSGSPSLVIVLGTHLGSCAGVLHLSPVVVPSPWSCRRTRHRHSTAVRTRSDRLSARTNARQPPPAPARPLKSVSRRRRRRAAVSPAGARDVITARAV